MHNSNELIDSSYAPSHNSNEWIDSSYAPSYNSNELIATSFAPSHNSTELIDPSYTPSHNSNETIDSSYAPSHNSSETIDPSYAQRITRKLAHNSERTTRDLPAPCVDTFYLFWFCSSSAFLAHYAVPRPNRIWSTCRYHLRRPTELSNINKYRSSVGVAIGSWLSRDLLASSASLANTTNTC